MFIKNNKILLIFLTLFSIISIVFVYNDYFLYQESIIHITDIKNKEIKIEGVNEKNYIQTIKGTIKNGPKKGKILTFKHTGSESSVYDELYHKGNDIFVELSNDNETVVMVSGVKRDKYVVVLFVIFVDLILLIAKKKGLLTFLSLIVNIVITGVAIWLYHFNYLKIGILPLFMLVSILFIGLSLYITNGKSKKTFAAIASAISSLFISFGLSFLIFKLYKGNIPFWTMEYVEVIFEYENFFYVSVLLSGLGAIMDISITLASSINELITKNPHIKYHELIKSGKEISKDIIGTMSNVMLFTCWTSIIPMVVLATRNYMSLANAIQYYGEIELIIVLTSCISIVLAIPISLYISALIMHPKKEALK
jgi:uncharacterized membrane protein